MQKSSADSPIMAAKTTNVLVAFIMLWTNSVLL